MNRHLFLPGGSAVRGGTEGTVCRWCGALEDEHTVGPETVEPSTPAWDSSQMVPEYTRRTLLDELWSVRLVWRIRRKKQTWGRQ